METVNVSTAVPCVKIGKFAGKYKNTEHKILRRKNAGDILECRAVPRNRLPTWYALPGYRQLIDTYLSIKYKYKYKTQTHSTQEHY